MLVDRRMISAIGIAVVQRCCECYRSVFHCALGCYEQIEIEHEIIGESCILRRNDCFGIVQSYMPCR